MTLIRYDEDAHRMTLHGHAGYAPEGQDIVCAAVSSLTYTLANALMGLEQQGLVTELSIRMDNGATEMACEPRGEAGQTALRTVFDTIMGGYELIARSYPEHVRARLIKK